MLKNVVCIHMIRRQQKIKLDFGPQKLEVTWILSALRLGESYDSTRGGENVDIKRIQHRGTS